MSPSRDEALLRSLWRCLEGPDEAPSSVAFTGPTEVLPSVFHVDTLAAASVALATLSAAELHRTRTGEARRGVTVDRRHSALAFQCERALTPVGWQMPPLWDPVAGNYETRDGFIRLHTNYTRHREAALRVLNAAAERRAVKEAVRGWYGEALEDAVVLAGGCAAVMRTRSEFTSHPQGRAVTAEPIFAWRAHAGDGPAPGPGGGRPLEGVRVLDLTRVIAGPVCTRFLSAYGADVLRIDPPGFDEVFAAVVDLTTGKRCAWLDLRRSADRATFERLVAEAHVLVVGYRSDAMERLGLGEEWRADVHPGLVTVALDAYGFTGPWATRRGFDSLVQMSFGIAAEGQRVARSPVPVPLPAQALDHGTGYLAAAAAARGLVHRLTRGEGSEIRLSLARTAHLLWELGTGGDPNRPGVDSDEARVYEEEVETVWGPVRRVRCPGTIEGIEPLWSKPPGPLGADPPRW